MANLPTSIDEDDRALNSLLDSFPSVSLDLIASAYTKADGDPNLAAELISCYTSNLSPPSIAHNCNPAHNPPLPSQPSISGRISQSSSKLPLAAPTPRLGVRPSHPQLLDYFPSSLEKNSWMEPLRGRLERNELSEKELSSYDTEQADVNEKFRASDSEFPYLSASDVYSDMNRSSVQQSFKQSNARTSRKVSVASGLIINARTRRNGKHPSKTTSHTEEISGDGDPLNGKNTIHGRTSLANKTEPTDIDAAERLLLSHLGDRFQLGIEAVRDVLGFYHGDLEKSWEALVQMSTATSSCVDDNVQNSKKPIDLHPQDAFQSCHVDGEKVAGCIMAKNEKSQAKTTQAFEEEMLKQEHSSMKWVLKRLCQEFPNAETATVREALRMTKFNYSDAQKVLVNTDLKEDSAESGAKDDQTELSNLILKTLFKRREDKKEDKAESTLSSQSEKPQQELAKSLEPVWNMVSYSDSCSQKDEEPTVQVRSYGDWDDYERHHQSTKQHWQMMDCYLKAANEAYASGDVSKAELLSNKGEKFKQLAVEAKERASKYLLKFKNPENENDFILDLKEQHVNEALKLLRLHLKTLSPIPSCNNFTVITGPLNDVTPGHIKVKQAVVRYLEKREIEWVETIPFCLQVKLKKVQPEA